MVIFHCYVSLPEGMADSCIKMYHVYSVVDGVYSHAAEFRTVLQWGRHFLDVPGSFDLILYIIIIVYNSWDCAGPGIFPAKKALAKLWCFWKKSGWPRRQSRQHLSTHAEPIGERRIPTKKRPPYVLLKDEERQHDRMQPKSTEHGMSQEWRCTKMRRSRGALRCFFAKCRQLVGQSV